MQAGALVKQFTKNCICCDCLWLYFLFPLFIGI